MAEILGKLFDLLKYLVSSLANLLEFTIMYILDLPVFLVTIFSNLPRFMQTGISMILTTLIVVFVMKIIKHVRDASVS